MKTMLLYVYLAACVFPNTLAEERRVSVILKNRGNFASTVDAEVTWTNFTCTYGRPEYQVSTFTKHRLESIYFVNTTNVVLRNQPYWKTFTIEVKYFCGGRLQFDPLRKSVEMEGGSLSPVRHLAVDARSDTTTFRWKQNSIDVIGASSYDFVIGAGRNSEVQTLYTAEVTLRNPLRPVTVISLRANSFDHGDDERYTSDKMTAVYLQASGTLEAKVKSLRVEQMPRSNIIRVTWAPIGYIDKPLYSVTWIRPDKTEYYLNTISTSIEMEVHGAHDSEQEIFVSVGDPNSGGLHVAGSEAATSFFYKSLPAPALDLIDSTSDSAVFNLIVADVNDELRFEVNDVAQEEPRLILKGLFHGGKYLVRAKACFIGGICGDEKYHLFTFRAPLKVEGFEVAVVSSSELRAIWRAPRDRSDDSFSGYRVTVAEIQGNTLYPVAVYEINSNETSCTISYNTSDTLYSLTIAAYEENEEKEIVGPISTESIVVPEVNDRVFAKAPEVRMIAPAIRGVKLYIGEISSEYLQLTVVDSSGRGTRASILKAEGNTVEYGSDLAPYQEYFGSLQACDESDSTKCGLPRNLRFRTLIGAPSAPSQLEATPVGTTRIELRWEPPINIGAPALDHYELELKKDDEVIANAVVSGQITSSAFHRLRAKTMYSIEVRAVNVDNSGNRFRSRPAAVTLSTHSASLRMHFIVVPMTLIMIGVAIFIIISRWKLKKASHGAQSMDRQLSNRENFQEAVLSSVQPAHASHRETSSSNVELKHILEARVV